MTGTVTFVPSVHFSPTHRRRVRETIRETEPDVVAVELGPDRFERVRRDDRPDPADLARELPPATAAAYSALRAVQETVVRLYGLDPGETDMEAAVETAGELGVDVALVDDPIGETMTALADRVGPATLPKLFVRAGSMTPSERLDQFRALSVPFGRIESGDDVQPMVDNLRRLLPEVAEVLIDRRDRAMAARLHRLRREGHDVVAVVGAGHHNGIQRALEDLEAQDADPDIDVPLRAPFREPTRIPVE